MVDILYYIHTCTHIPWSKKNALRDLDRNVPHATETLSVYYGISTRCHVLLLTALNRGTWVVIPNHYIPVHTCICSPEPISAPVLTGTEGMLTGRIVAGSIFAWRGVDLCPIGQNHDQDLFLRNCLLLYAAEKLGDVLYIREGIPTSQGALSGPPQGGTDHLSKYRSGKKW